MISDHVPQQSSLSKYHKVYILCVSSPAPLQSVDKSGSTNSILIVKSSELNDSLVTLLSTFMFTSLLLHVNLLQTNYCR